MSLVKSPKDIVEEAEASGSAGLLSRHDSWGRVEIGNVATIQNGAPFPSTSFNTNRSGFPIIRIRDVGKNEISTWFDGEYSDDFIVRHGDLLIGMDGDFRSSRWLGEPALLNQRVCRLIVSDSRIGQAFIEFALPAYLDAIADETSSITVKHLSSKSIQQIPLPLPPLAEQERIVEILEEQFSRLDSALASVKAVREKSKAFRRSLLHSAFNGELTGGTDGWREVALKDLAEGGNFFDGDWVESKDQDPNGTVRLVQLSDVGEGNFRHKSDRWLREDQAEGLGVSYLVAGDLLIARMPDPMGRSCRVPVLPTQSITAVDVAVLRIRRSDVNPDFTMWQINSPLARSIIVGLASGTTRQRISRKNLGQVTLFLPPLSEQERIVEILEEQFSKLDKALEVANQLEARIASERRSLLHAAFTGELTSQWRKTHV